jgi:hypothetical protein
VAYRVIFWIADPIPEVSVERENARAELLFRNADMRTRMFIGLNVLNDLMGEGFCMCLDQFD